MSGELPKQLDVRRQLSRESGLDGELPVASCSRLAELVVRDSGALTVQLRFARNEQGQPRVTGRLRGTLWLACQRCMQPVDVDVDQALDLVILPSESAAQRLEREQDFCVAEDGNLDVWALLEDEALLALPIVARHQELCRQMPSASGPAAQEETAPERESPFAGLADMLKNRKPDN